LFFLLLCRMSWEFWWELHWTCRLFLVIWPFSQCWFYQSMRHLLMSSSISLFSGLQFLLNHWNIWILVSFSGKG
jgi:hypothetical protein